MALLLQNDNGTVTGANGYVSASYVTSYFADRGIVLTASTAEIEAAIVRATSYLDMRFRFIGMKAQWGQTTQWPRYDAIDRDGRLVYGVPLPIKQAVCEYAYRALSSTLMPDPTKDESGRIVSLKTTQVGPIREVTQYMGSQNYVLPDYPEADNILVASGLLLKDRRVARA